ncbi:MAG: hypothetical protein LBF93_04220, partial [Zoogloeaceae bacterium]|nr:hypothetical protein [Zoogloeaceae bacterium]
MFNFFRRSKKTDNGENAPDTPAPQAPPLSAHELIRRNWAESLGAQAEPATDALNARIVQAVRFNNAEIVAQAPAQISIVPNLM